MERETTLLLDDLDTALFLMTKINVLYDRLEPKDRQILLQITADQIMIDLSGEIVYQELHSPFAYLKSLMDNFTNQNHIYHGLEHV